MYGFQDLQGQQSDDGSDKDDYEDDYYKKLETKSTFVVLAMATRFLLVGFVQDLKASSGKNAWRLVGWTAGWIGFTWLGFGAVYFILSFLAFICLNTRTGSKDDHVPSAYGVFNRGQETILGDRNQAVDEQLRRGTFR